MGKKTVQPSFQQIVLGNWIVICKKKKKKLNCYCTSYIKINSKLIKDLNIRTKTIKFLRKHRCESLWPWIMQFFFFWIWFQKQNNQRKKKFTSSKLKNVAHQWTLSRWKEHREWENIFVNYISEKGACIQTM